MRYICVPQNSIHMRVIRGRYVPSSLVFDWSSVIIRLYLLPSSISQCFQDLNLSEGIIAKCMVYCEIVLSREL